MKNNRKIRLIISIGVLLSVFLCNKTFSQVSYNGCTTTGNYSSALGLLNNATGHYSFSSGSNSTALGLATTTLGSYNEANGNYSIIVGGYATIDQYASESIIIGFGASHETGMQIENFYSQSIMFATQSTKPSFFIGKSPADNMTGRLGIGNVTEPQAKLHIKLDNGVEEAAYGVFIEPSSWAAKTGPVDHPSPVFKTTKTDFG